MFSAMDGMNDGAVEPGLPARVLSVDGDGLERWVLKSFCGGLFSGAFRVSPTETMKSVRPPTEWLHILFAGADFPPGQGLYYMPKKTGETVTADQFVLRFEPIGSRDGEVIGGLRVWFLGFEFALLMGNIPPGVPTMFDGAMYRPAGLRAVESGTRVRLDWKRGSRSDEAVFSVSKDPASRADSVCYISEKGNPMDPKKVVASKWVESDLDLYATFFEHGWAQEMARRLSSTKLESAFDNLCMAWKEAANTHRLPWLMIMQVKAFVGGYRKEQRPYGVRLIEALKARLTKELGGSLRHMQKKKIDEVLERIDDELREREKGEKVALDTVGYWNQLIGESEFQLSIWGSQRLSYCALIFAYEWFVVSCFRLLGGLEKVKPNEEKFWKGFQTMLGRDVKPDYWDDKPVKIARLARNCIAHLGGKAKQDLLDESPPLFISDEGIITIQPSDTRGLFTLLKGKATSLIDEALPKLA
jgi:hypothetical protein